MTNKNEILINEAYRQGQAYSRLLTEEYDTFWNSRFWDISRRETARWMLKWSRSLGSTRATWNVLEVGCGIGWTAIEVAHCAPWIDSLQAIDPSKKAIEEAERLIQISPFDIKKKLSFSEDSLFEHSGGPYDLIYMHEVFEHIPNPQAVFKKALELVYTGGCLMISTPNFNRLENRVRKILRWERRLIDPLHIREYSLGELKTLPEEGWDCLKASGKMLFSSFVLSGILSLGFKYLAKKIRPITDRLEKYRLNYLLGGLSPNLSTKLLVLYKSNIKQ